MTHKVTADSSSEAIRALREEGYEPIFSVDEHKSLDEIMSEIDWSKYGAHDPSESSMDPNMEPVYHLDDMSADQYLIPRANRVTRDKALSLAYR
ncbi:MAG: hypothetical protein KKB70_11335 [Proteobacteria bacterium]|nr:hypothetical protein [Pseudomonadota bacterium]MBU1612519.1 hypothetical protein [Pseudomonadota bacterium]